MAFTAPQKISICQILGVTPVTLDAYLVYLGDKLTVDIQTAIIAQIAIWDSGVGTKTVKLHPTESNKGVETNPFSARGDVQKNIAVLLEWTDLLAGAGGQTRTVRG